MLEERVYDVYREILGRPVFHQLLLVLVEDDHEDVLATHPGELNSLLDNTPLPLTVGNVTLHFVLNELVWIDLFLSHC